MKPILFCYLIACLVIAACMIHGQGETREAYLEKKINAMYYAWKTDAYNRKELSEENE